MTRWLDPDRRYFSPDKYAHGVMGVFAGLIEWTLRVDHLGFWRFMLVGLVIAVTYELGQTDADHSAGKLGQPGHGFGLLDIVWDMKGILLAYALLSALCLT